MRETGTWHGADDGALAWLESVANVHDPAGFGVGPMPDKVFVLQPLFERIDGGQMSRSGDDPAEAVREVSWREYAEHRGIPMFVGRGYASSRDALPGAWDDGLVSPPGEGVLIDEHVRDAVLDTLLAHTPNSDQLCTAYFHDFYVGDSQMPQRPPNILRGPLSAWRELWELPDYALTPQNFWPDDHSWVLGTHVDSWATEISGPVALIEDLIASPALEALRLPHLG